MATQQRFIYFLLSQTVFPRSGAIPGQTNKGTDLLVRDEYLKIGRAIKWKTEEKDYMRMQ